MKCPELVAELMPKQLRVDGETATGSKIVIL